ncbi:MAG: dihydrofolate reductase [Erysipelothrix sp.]|nr:dihydrofolate reductase [Erysipelothrix sp.]
MLTLVVACNKHRTIGLDGKMPWHAPEDLKHFKNYTMGKKVVMGRKTFNGLPKKLIGRDMYIVSRTPQGENSITDFNAFLQENKDTKEEIIIAGGGEIYKMALPFADKIVLSIIKDNDVVGDTFFPEIDTNVFEIESKEIFETFDCITYTRKDD